MVAIQIPLPPFYYPERWPLSPMSPFYPNFTLFKR